MKTVSKFKLLAINVRQVFGLPGIAISSPGLNLLGAIESTNENVVRGKRKLSLFLRLMFVSQILK